MNPKAPQLLAGDTNVGMDLAQGHEWVLDAISTIRRRLPGCSLLVPPTVSEELAWLATHAEQAAQGRKDKPRKNSPAQKATDAMTRQIM